MIGIAAAIGPGLGAALLAAQDHWEAFAVGEALDVGGLAYFTYWIVPIFLNLKRLNESDLPPLGQLVEPRAHCRLCDMSG
jgi:hypothetical protein